MTSIRFGFSSWTKDFTSCIYGKKLSHEYISIPDEYASSRENTLYPASVFSLIRTSWYAFDDSYRIPDDNGDENVIINKYKADRKPDKTRSFVFFKKKTQSNILQRVRKNGETKAVLSAPTSGNRTVDVPTEPRNDQSVE